MAEKAKKVINATFNALVRLGLCESQIDFSRRWLAQSDRYYSHLLATSSETSSDVLLYLAESLSKTRTRLLSGDRPAGRREEIAAAVLLQLLGEVHSTVRQRIAERHGARRASWQIA